MKTETKTKMDSIPSSLQSLLRDLAFLGQITRGVKPCIKTRELVSADSWIHAFYRFYKGENRTLVITQIESIINQCVESINTHKNSEHLKIIIEYTNDAYNGIKTLNSTYGNDPDILSRLNVVLKNLDLQLDKYRHLIKGYNVNDVNNVKEEVQEVPENVLDLFGDEKKGKIRLKRSVEPK